MDSDEEIENYIYTDDFVNEVCENCGYETNTVTHYEMCDYDHKMVANAQKWIRYIEYFDMVIDEYHRLCDEGYYVHKNWVVDELSKFEEWDNNH